MPKLPYLFSLEKGKNKLQYAGSGKGVKPPTPSLIQNLLLSPHTQGWGNCGKKKTKQNKIKQKTKKKALNNPKPASPQFSNGTYKDTERCNRPYRGHMLSIGQRERG